MAAAAVSAPVAGVSDRDRLAAIGYRLARANGDSCELPEQMTGLTVHDFASYDEPARAGVASAYQMGRGFGILAIVPESAADRAGLRRGDEITSVNGQSLSDFGLDRVDDKASYDRVETFLTLLDRELRSGPAIVNVARKGEELSLSLEGDAGCGGQFTVAKGKQLNAWSDGRYVAVTTKLMATVVDDSELAFVVAHEMAHNILKHRERLKGKSAFFAQLGLGAHGFKSTEVEADSYAVQLMAKAGFDLDAPGRFLASSSKKRWMDLPLTHPGIKRRIDIVDAAIVELRGVPTHAAEDTMGDFAPVRMAEASLKPPALHDFAATLMRTFVPDHLARPIGSDRLIAGQFRSLELALLVFPENPPWIEMESADISGQAGGAEDVHGAVTGDIRISMFGSSVASGMEFALNLPSLNAVRSWPWRHSLMSPGTGQQKSYQRQCSDSLEKRLTQRNICFGQ